MYGKVMGVWTYIYIHMYMYTWCRSMGNTKLRHMGRGNMKKRKEIIYINVHTWIYTLSRNIDMHTTLIHTKRGRVYQRKRQYVYIYTYILCVETYMNVHAHDGHTLPGRPGSIGIKMTLFWRASEKRSLMASSDMAIGRSHNTFLLWKFVQVSSLVWGCYD